MAIVEEKKAPVKKAHSLILQDRRTALVSGVTDVDSFDEQSVVLFTEQGELTIEGSDLHMNRLNVETGDVSIEGIIDSVSYRDEAPRGGGFFGRIFK